MNNNKMNRVANNLDTLVNVGGKITAGIGVVCVAVSFIAFVFGTKMFTSANTTLNLDFIKFHLNDNSIDVEFMKFYVFAAALSSGIICFIVYYISKLLREILAPMKMGRPFENGVAKNLKKIGWVIIIGGFFSELVGVIARILLIHVYSIDQLFLSEGIIKTEFVFTFNLNFALIACVVFFLSYIFMYGQVLQQESDETL